jgi:hypothetical protein
MFMYQMETVYLKTETGARETIDADTDNAQFQWANLFISPNKIIIHSYMYIIRWQPSEIRVIFCRSM